MTMVEVLLDLRGVTVPAPCFSEGGTNERKKRPSPTWLRVQRMTEI
jgi:hypothetical protein